MTSFRRHVTAGMVHRLSSRTGKQAMVYLSFCQFIGNVYAFFSVNKAIRDAAGQELDLELGAKYKIEDYSVFKTVGM